MTIEQSFKATTGLSIQEGIEKAIEGGYEPFLTVCAEDVSLSIVVGELVGEAKMGMPYRRNLSSIFLDPLFWQSLGKAMGWEVVAENGYNEEKLIRSYRGYSKGYGEKMWKSALKKEAWNYQWHRFIDKLADGGTAEQFFEEL